MIENVKKLENKKTILIDFDGVLNNYTGEYDKAAIPEIKKGAKDFIINLSKDYNIKIFTSRNKVQTCKWLIKNKLDGYIIDITDVKEPAWVYIDDRCIKFDGDYDNLQNEIMKFKTWYK